MSFVAESAGRLNITVDELLRRMDGLFSVHDIVGSNGPRVIVVGYDGSSPSRNALAYAVGLAQRQGSELVIVEVNPVSAYGPPILGGSGVVPEVEASLTGSVDAGTVAWLRSCLGHRWHVESLLGDPAAELERISGELASDAIVIGRSRGLVRHPLGSVTGRLIRSARRPVIVVP